MERRTTTTLIASPILMILRIGSSTRMGRKPLGSRQRRPCWLSSLGVISLLLSSLCIGLPYDAAPPHEGVFGIAWGPEIEISTDAGAEWQCSPSIAVEGSKVYVVWTEQGTEFVDEDIHYRYFDGSNWQPEVKISTATEPRRQGHPAIAVEESRVHVVWEYSDRLFMVDPDYELRYRVLNGTDWEFEQVISTRRNSALRPAPVIAVDGDNVHVMWVVNLSGSLTGVGPIYYRVYNGTSWGPEIEFIPGTNRFHSIATENGKIHVAWERYGYFDSQVYYKYFNGTSWQLDQKFSAGPDGVGEHDPSMAVEGDIVHFAWRYGFNGPYDIYYRSFNGTSWTSPKKINVDPPWDPWYDGNPSIAANGGKVHVAWESQEDGDSDINYRFFDGGDWGPVQRVNTDTTSKLQYSPSIAAEGGKVHIVWVDERDGDPDIYYRSGIIDSSPPASSASPISPYWQTSTTFDVEWTATDDHTLANVSLYYRYSSDNSSWSDWVEWSYDSTISGAYASGTFPFTATYGEGFYEFYTIANDSAGNLETAPLVADAIAGVPRFPSPPTNLTAFLSGTNFQDVTLFWNLSLEDGEGRDDIISYDIYRGTVYDSSGSSYPHHASVPAGVPSFVDNLAGEGDSSNYFYFVCSVNIYNLSSCTVDQAGKFTRPLTQGVNLVSIPLIQPDESALEVLQTVSFDKAWSYDSTNTDWDWLIRFKSYKGELRRIDHRMGVWINVTQASNLIVAGVVPSATTILLRAGWNLVGFPSFKYYSVQDLINETGAIRIEGYDFSSPYFLREVQADEFLSAGEAYWIEITNERVWKVSNV